MNAISSDLVGRLYTQVKQRLDAELIPLWLFRATEVRDGDAKAHSRQVWLFSRLFRKYPRRAELGRTARAGVDGWIANPDPVSQCDDARAIYALAEYFLASGDPRGMEHACAAFERLITERDDGRNFNSQLQRLEAFTVLYAASGSDVHGRRLREVIDALACDAAPGGERALELLWLMRLALETLGADLRPYWELWNGMATHALQRGSEWECMDVRQHAEALVGFLDAYELFGDERYLEAYESIWSFVCPRRLRWDEKSVDPWEFAYHTGRAMIECAERLERLK